MERSSVSLIKGLCFLALVGSLVLLDFMCAAPKIPAYPNATGAVDIPSRIEAQLLGESFGVFKTVDSAEAVRVFYAQRLAEEGWRNGWYQNRAGYCYTLLIIPSYSVETLAEGMIGVNFKLCQASSDDKTAPAGCR